MSRRPVRNPDLTDSISPARALADALPLGVLVCDAARLLWANTQAQRMFGADLATLLARPPSALFQPVEDLTPLLHASARDERSLYLRRADDALLHVCVTSSPWLPEGRNARLLLISDLAEGDRIRAQLTRQREELQAMARRVMTLQEDERASLSRELHDDIGQAITAIKLCALSMQHEDEQQRGDTIGEIAAIADQTVAKLRDLSLLLRPPQLDALGLEAALRWQASHLFRSDSPTLELDLSSPPTRAAPAVELACFRIAQEALTNVLRHADARNVRVELRADANRLCLRVEDDGHGFDPLAAYGLGLVTMRERAQQLGGRLDIDSHPGRGTRLRAELPLRLA